MKKTDAKKSHATIPLRAVFKVIANMPICRLYLVQKGNFSLNLPKYRIEWFHISIISRLNDELMMWNSNKIPIRSAGATRIAG